MLMRHEKKQKRGVLKRAGAAIGTCLLAGLMILSPKPAKAENFDVYNNTKITNTMSSDTNIIVKKDQIKLGAVIEDADETTVTLGTEVNVKETGTKILGHVRLKDPLAEVKLDQQLTDNAHVLLAYASPDVFYGGFQYGKLKPFGFGLGYIQDGEDGEVKIEVWKYFEKAQFFIGLRKSKDNLMTVLSKPTDPFTTRLMLLNDFNGDLFVAMFEMGQKSGKGMYTLNVGDSFFLIDEEEFYRSKPMKINKGPFMYIAPPMGWRTEGFGLKLKYTKSGNDHSICGEFVKHIKKLFLGASYELKIGEKGAPGIIIGFSGDALKLQGVVKYDIDMQEPIAELAMKAQF